MSSTLNRSRVLSHAALFSSKLFSPCIPDQLCLFSTGSLPSFAGSSLLPIMTLEALTMMSIGTIVVLNLLVYSCLSGLIDHWCLVFRVLKTIVSRIFAFPKILFYTEYRFFPCYYILTRNGRPICFFFFLSPKEYFERNIESTEKEKRTTQVTLLWKEHVIIFPLPWPWQWLTGLKSFLLLLFISSYSIYFVFINSFIQILFETLLCVWQYDKWLSSGDSW